MKQQIIHSLLASTLLLTLAVETSATTADATLPPVELQTQTLSSAISDFTFGIKDGTYAYVTGYTGSGGAVTIPSTYQGLPVRVIGSDAFRNMKSITNITIPEGVTEIWGNAFYGCEGLRSVTFPNSLTKIGDSAFQGCSSLTRVTIPSTVTSVGRSVFAQCSSLTTATIDAILTKDSEALFVYCPALTQVHLGEGNTLIPQSMFAYCDALVSITLPSTITSIEGGAFERCASLTSVYVPSSLTDVYFTAFSDCYALSNLYYQGNQGQFDAISYGKNGQYTSDLVFYQSMHHWFDANVVCDMGSMPSYHGVPYSVDSEFEVMGGTILKYVGNGTHVTIPETINGRTITKIADDAFSQNNNLVSVVMADTVKYLGRSNFYECANLSSLTLSDSLLQIGYASIMSCPKLTELVLPNQLIDTENLALFDLTGLTTVTLPKSLLYIGMDAFRDANQLKTVYYYGTAEDRANIRISAGSAGTEGSEGFATMPWIYLAEEPTPEVTVPEVTVPTTPSTSKIATPSTAKVRVGEEYFPFGAYNIDGYNYFRLVDLGYAFDQWPQSFSIQWDASKNAINLKRFSSHVVTGDEMTPNSGQNEVADLFTSPIYLDGNLIAPEAYIIGGSSYFQLAALEGLLGFGLEWDSVTSTIQVNVGK